MPAAQRRSEFAGFAALRLLRSRSTASSGASGSCCCTDRRGLPLGYTIVPANEKEYEPLADLLTGTPAEAVIADKGFWGRDYASGSPPPASSCSPRQASAPPPTAAANARSPPPGW